MAIKWRTVKSQADLVLLRHEVTAWRLAQAGVEHVAALLGVVDPSELLHHPNLLSGALEDTGPTRIGLIMPVYTQGNLRGDYASGWSTKKTKRIKLASSANGWSCQADCVRSSKGW